MYKPTETMRFRFTAGLRKLRYKASKNGFAAASVKRIFPMFL